VDQSDVRRLLAATSPASDREAPEGHVIDAVQIIRGTMPFASLKLEGPTDGIKNPRESTGIAHQDIAELGEHIGLHGLIHPLLVSPERVVIAGGRRYRAIAWLIEAYGDVRSVNGRGRFSVDELTQLYATASTYVDLTPVGVVKGTLADIEALAIADNVHRVQLSSFEVARYLQHLSQRQGLTGVEIARRIGKSSAYVSKKLVALKNAGDTLIEAWKSGTIGDELVYELAALPFSEQRRRILTDELPKRGAAQRPPIDVVKEALADLVIWISRHETIGAKVDAIARMKRAIASGDPADLDAETYDPRYTAGVADAMKWFTGKTSSRELAELLAKVSS
jgi:hypothetical protein